MGLIWLERETKNLTTRSKYTVLKYSYVKATKEIYTKQHAYN